MQRETKICKCPENKQNRTTEYALQQNVIKKKLSETHLIIIIFHVFRLWYEYDLIFYKNKRCLNAETRFTRLKNNFYKYSILIKRPISQIFFFILQVMSI